MIDISSKIVKLLIEKGLTLSTAESCTGGLAAKSITDISGASQAFFGGVVSYDNSVKQNVLGVNKDTLDTHGAVSYQTACQMAQGVKELMKTDIGISTTGIAGPGGGTPKKPVGTVYIGVAYKNTVDAYLLQLEPTYTRDEIRCKTVEILLNTVYEKILQNY